MRFIQHLALVLTFTGVSSGCGKIVDKIEKHNEKKNEPQISEAEVLEDSKLPQLPLLSALSLVEKVNIWQFTEANRIWTPKGDAVFVGGRGAQLNRLAGTIVWITKSPMAATVESLPVALNKADLAKWDRLLESMNRVELPAIERNCASSEIEAQDNIVLVRASDRETILNYRKAECVASYTDSVTFKNVVDLMKAQGATW